MSIPKIILIASVAVFAIIGVTAMVKKNNRSAGSAVADQPKAKELKPDSVSVEAPKKNLPVVIVKEIPPKSESQTVKADLARVPPSSAPVVRIQDDFPNIDRIYQLFTTGPTKLPIVETLSYSSRVPWLKGRPAWVADYASYYGTSRHFIARSLNGKADYLSQKVSAESRFNVFRKDKHIQFHLLADISRCKMGLYYYDLDTNERVLLKTYAIGVGRLDPNKLSGSLTPVGKYTLGSKVAIYKPGTTGYYMDTKVEMINVFGTRWIPFDQELAGTAIPSKGYGLQGAPWTMDAKGGQMVENRECIGKFDSDGCIRLSTEDMEELFAIVITKPSIIEIVRDFREAKLPGVEVATPKR